MFTLTQFTYNISISLIYFLTLYLLIVGKNLKKRRVFK